MTERGEHGTAFRVFVTGVAPYVVQRKIIIAGSATRRGTGRRLPTRDHVTFICVEHRPSPLDTGLRTRLKRL